MEVRKTSGKRWLRCFNGKKILRDMVSKEFKDWDVDKFAEALVLRSFGAVPGVWRLPVWEQAEDMNSECFSCLGSWSFRRRIPQRTHTQLYGTMCGILESIHQVRAPPAQWAELARWRRSLGRVVRGSAGIILVSHVTTVARQAHLDIPTWTSRKACLHTSPHQVYFGRSWLDTCSIPRRRRHSSCLPVSTDQIQVFLGLWGSSVLQSWALVCEKGD